MYQIYHNIKIDATKEKVYEYCTDPGHINNWWTKRCSGSPALDEEYMFWFAPQYDWRAKVIDLIGKELISFSFFQADADWMDTILTLEVYETSHGITTLHLRHAGWKEENEHFGRTSYCWAMYLSTLKRYAEVGEVVPYEQRGGN